MIGQTLASSYTIVRTLGEGGMGRVYEARHTRIGGKRFAVKMLHPEFTRQPEVLTRFQREAEAAATIDSPYVVDVYDVDRTADGRAFLVAEFLQGKEFAGLPRGGRQDAGRRRGADRAPDLQGAGRRPRQGRRPPRHEARERLPHRGPDAAPRQGHRLRHLQARRRARHRAHQDGDDHGHALVHGARASARRACRPPRRHLRRGRHPLLRAHRPAPLRSRRPHRHPHGGAHPGSRRALARSSPPSPSRSRWSSRRRWPSARRTATPAWSSSTRSSPPTSRAATPPCSPSPRARAIRGCARPARRWRAPAR